MLFLPSIRPQFTVDLREWYVAEYKEPLFVHPPALLQVVFGLGGCLLNPAYPVAPYWHCCATIRLPRWICWIKGVSVAV